MSELSGKIVRIQEVEVISDSFSKRVFAIETDDQYPQTVSFELTGKSLDLTEKHNVGDTVNVHYNIRGRDWTNKQGQVQNFVTLNAWRIEKESSTPKSTPAPKQSDDFSDDSFADDLPF